MDPVHAFFQQILGAAGIVADPVVRTVCDHGIGGLFSVVRNGHRIDAFPDRRFTHTAGRDRTDDAVTVPRRQQIDRYRTRVDQPLFDGLMAIPVAQRQIPLPQTRLHDRPVRPAGANDHRVGFIRPEHFCRKDFALMERAFMVQQRSDTAPFDPRIRAEQVLSVKVIKLFPDRTFCESNSPLMTGRRPGIFMAFLIVRPDRLHERRQQFSPAPFDGSLDPARDEHGAVLIDPHELVGKFHQTAGDPACCRRPVPQQEDGDHALPFPDMFQRRQTAALVAFIHTYQKGIDIHIAFDDGERLLRRHGPDHHDIPFQQRLNKPADRLFHHRAGVSDLVLNDQHLPHFQFVVFHPFFLPFYSFTTPVANRITASTAIAAMIQAAHFSFDEKISSPVSRRAQT